MINCLIVDDEQHALDILVQYVSQMPHLNLVKATTSSKEALEITRRQQVELIFLDVQMPEMSGLELIKLIEGKIKIILCTAYSEFAFAGYENDVVDFLMKPISYPRFIKAVQKATNLIAADYYFAAAEDLEDDYIFVKSEYKGKMIKINLEDIDYIEGMKNYVAIYRGKDKILALLNMKDLEERLPKKKFMRVHKSFIIALNRVTVIEGNHVVLQNITASVPMGEMYKQAFMERIKNKLML
jgi:two-component system, LytTR family, response regulator